MSQPSKYGLLNRFNLEDIYNLFLGMDQKQQLISLGGIVLGLLLLIFMPVTCATRALSNLEKQYVASKEAQDKFMAKLVAYEQTKDRISQLKEGLSQTSTSSSLTAIVESIAQEAGLEELISQSKGLSLGDGEFFSEDGISVSFNKISLEQITGFMDKVDHYAQAPLKVKMLQIKPRLRDREELTATVEISVLKAKKVVESE